MSDRCQQSSSVRRRACAIARLATAASLFFSLECVAARDLETGIQAYSKGRFDKAYPILHHHADLGNTTAQMYLCRLYQQGDGKLENADLAYQWCKRAAVDGLDEAQFELGVIEVDGDDGVGGDHGGKLDHVEPHPARAENGNGLADPEVRLPGVRRFAASREAREKGLEEDRAAAEADGED